MGNEHAPESVSRSVTVKGRYRIVGPGVADGETVVYPAESVASQQAVALAVLRGDGGADAEFVTAVREQAYRLAKPVCQHRSLVRVYDTGTTDEGEPFVALEPVAGRSLRELLDERGVLAPPEALRLAIQIGEGLETLHRSGIVHGELRPESIVLVKDGNGDEAVKLIGVELTAARRTPAGLPIRDKTVGAYLAPEQTAHGETSEASDVHALGVLIVELLTGQRPDARGRRGPAEMPPAIGRIVAKAVEPGPGRRYSSISLMVNDLWSVETEPAKAPARVPAASSAVRKSSGGRRARSDVGMATALVVGLLLVGVTAWFARSDRAVIRDRSASPEPSVAASPVTPPPGPVAVTPTPTPTPSPLPAAPAPTAEESTTAMPMAAPAPTAPATPPSAVLDAAEVRPALPPRVEAARPATVGAVRGPRPAARQPERQAPAEPPSADGGDGTAIIDWLLKSDRGGG